ncbi:MAG: hypothetical protein FWF51_13150, partial [Chitinivibrionia bacterium]|nr:hypothetical protein [Chitinivibrionia bacterium]
KGVSMLYVLMALVCVGAMGSLVLSMAKKEKADSSLRYSSELARYGATGGLVLAVNEPLKTQKFVDLIEKWYKIYNGKLTIPNSEKEQWEKEKYLDLGVIDKIEPSGTSGYYQDQNGNKLRARVVNVDFSGLRQDPPVINMMVECESIDRSGSRAKNVAFYKVHGWTEEVEENFPKSALYMGGGMDEINLPLVVTGVDNKTTGDTFFKGSGMINSQENEFGNSALSPNGGEFRLRDTITTGTQSTNVGVLKGSKFYGPAYFGIVNGVTGNAPYLNVRRWFSDGANEFYGKVGLETSVFLAGTARSVNFYDDVYLNGAIRMETPNSNDNNKWTFKPKHGKTGNYATDFPKLYYTNVAIYDTVGSMSYESGWNAKKSETKLSDMHNETKTISGESVTIEDNTTYTTITTQEILSKLEMGNEPPSINIFLDKLPFPPNSTPVNNKTPGSSATGITGKDLNTEYQNQKISNSLYRYDGMPPEEDGWMLLRLGGNSVYATIFADPSSSAEASEAFTGKMVLLIEGNSGGNNGGAVNLFVSGANSNSLILVEHQRTAAQLGHNNLIRGLIVKRGDGDLNLSSTGPNMILRGAAYCVKGNNAASRPKFRLEGRNSNPKLRIEYDEKVLKQIMKELPGVVCIEDGKPCDDNNSDSELSEMVDFSKISAKQVSRLF